MGRRFLIHFGRSPIAWTARGAQRSWRAGGRIDNKRSEKLCPFVVGLGVPKWACPAIGILSEAPS